MKITCGTDIIEIERIQKVIENSGERFLRMIFTENERKYCEQHKNQRYQHYAARFAAKEATFKAVGNYIDLKKVNWKTFEVKNFENGKPDIEIHYELEGLQCIDISISHCRKYAVANVVAMFN